MVFFGCMSLGSALWGQIATLTSIPLALLMAAAGVVLAIPLTWRARLGQGEQFDLTPSASWPQPEIVLDSGNAHDRGPVLVTVRYSVKEADIAPFLKAMNEVASERYRNGASRWGLFQDAASPQTWLESFTLPSWLEHLHHHERVNRHDADIHDVARRFHQSAEKPEVHHFLAPSRHGA